MKPLKNQKIKCAILFLITVLSPFSLSLADGNHPWAKSEAWTWMGQVNVINEGPTVSLNTNGYAFIHYFTRNETGQGRMNFKTSAITKTKDGIGVEYDKRTIFPTPRKQEFELSVSEKTLSLNFKYKNEVDSIYETEMNDQDWSNLKNTLLPLYPGLRIYEESKVKKVLFKGTMGKNTRVDLTFYSIWPDISPPNQKMTFYGLEDSYTFSSPMLVTYGTWQESANPVQKVAGLSFLDRQWSRDYFGKKVFADPTVAIKNQQALPWAHNWSAFHARSTNSDDWYFVHLWKQVKRAPNVPDVQTEYTGIQWSKNGEQQAPIKQNLFSWIPRQFQLNSSNVLMNFAEGRKAYFPFVYELSGNSLGNVTLSSSPSLQSLDQPIYLYEGYASGHGNWDLHPVQVQGRLESSQILFRDQDYQDILKNIDTSSDQQASIAADLNEMLSEANSRYSPVQRWQDDSNYVFHDLGRKWLIFTAQFSRKPKQMSPGILTYY